MFAGHRLVCYEDATATDVRRAQVLFGRFRSASRPSDGWDFDVQLLPRLGLDASALRGKVLVHLDDEYGARRPKRVSEVEPTWRTYCAMYAGWRHVFRNYWSAGWAERVGRNHAMNCSCGSDGGGCAGHGSRPPRVEWVPLGWSANWQPRLPSAPPLRRSSERATVVGFYGNEKYQLRPNRASLIARFERETASVVTRALGRVGFGRGNATEYARAMRDTRFCLQISGLSAECYRMYESLDAGCIPLLVDEFGLPGQTAAQYRFLLGGAASPRRAPFPRAEKPAGLRETLARLAADATALDALQLETGHWWNRTLSRLTTRVQSVARPVCARGSDH